MQEEHASQVRSVDIRVSHRLMHQGDFYASGFRSSMEAAHKMSGKYGAGLIVQVAE